MINNRNRTLPVLVASVNNGTIPHYFVPPPRQATPSCRYHPCAFVVLKLRNNRVNIDRTWLYGISFNKVYKYMAHCDRNRTLSFNHFSIFLGSSLPSYIPPLPHLYLPLSFLFLGPPPHLSLLQYFIFFFLYLSSLNQLSFLNSCHPSPFLSYVFLL
jgi:hypothetical protein